MQIMPIRDLKDTAKISEICNMTNEPIFVTKNGYGDLVVMSLKAYENRVEENILFQRLAELERGELVNGKQVFERLIKKYEQQL